MKKRIIMLLVILLGAVLILLYTNFGFNFFKKESKANQETITQFVENYRALETEEARRGFCSNAYSEFIYYNNDTHSCAEYYEASNANIIGSYSSYVKYQHYVVDITKTDREFISSNGKVKYIEYVVISKYKLNENSSFQSFRGVFYFVEHNGKTIYSYEHLPIRWSIFSK